MLIYNSNTCESIRDFLIPALTPLSSYWKLVLQQCDKAMNCTCTLLGIQWRQQFTITSCLALFSRFDMLTHEPIWIMSICPPFVLCAAVAYPQKQINFINLSIPAIGTLSLDPGILASITGMIVVPQASSSKRCVCLLPQHSFYSGACFSTSTWYWTHAAHLLWWWWTWRCWEAVVWFLLHVCVLATALTALLLFARSPHCWLH